EARAQRRWWPARTQPFTRRRLRGGIGSWPQPALGPRAGSGGLSAMTESVSDRVHLAQKIGAVKQRVAQAISDEFFLHHPEWATRYGARGRQFCTDDACFHMDFLAGAIEAGSPEAFADYSRWTERMLAARGIAE